MTSEDELHIYFNTRDELLDVPLHEVVYFEAEGNWTLIYFANGIQSQVLASLSAIEILIGESIKRQTNQPHLQFIRIGRRYIINMDKIHHIDLQKHTLELTDFRFEFTYELSISKEALRKLKDTYKPVKQ